MRPPLSILVPVYNSETNLAACLASIAAQTHSDFEAILIDDGSTDESNAILHEFSRTDARFRVVEQPNKGAYPTKNVALTHATGRYLLFVDSDDIVAPALAEKALARAEAEDSDITLFGWDYLPGSPYAPPDVACWNLLEWHDEVHGIDFPLRYGYMWMKLYRTDFIRHNNLRFREEFYSKADVVFHWISMSLAERVSVIPEVLYHYRVHGNSLTGTIGARFIEILAVMEAIKAELIAIGDPRHLLAVWLPFSLRFIHSAYLQAPAQSKEKMRTEIREFLGRLDPAERENLVGCAHLAPDVLKFFSAIERKQFPHERSGVVTRRGALAAVLKKLVHLEKIKRRLLLEVQRRSYSLARASTNEQNLRRTVQELNDRLHRLSRDNQYLKSQLETRERG